MEQEIQHIEVPYKVKFTNNGPVPVDKVVESLLAYEKLLKRTGPFIEEAFSGINVIEIVVLVTKIEAGSLTEDLVVKILFKTDENYQKAKEVMATMLDNNKPLTIIVGLGVAAYITFGVMKHLPGGSPTNHIEAHHGAIVQLGGTMNISEKAIDKILNKVSDKKQLSKESIAAIAPAHLEKGASIEINDLKDLTITPEFIKEAPLSYDPPELQQKNDIHQKVNVEIWASDKESNTKSWAGTVPGIVDKRVKFNLDEAVHSDDVHGKRSIVADIVVNSTYSVEKQEYIPRRVEILSVY